MSTAELPPFPDFPSADLGRVASGAARTRPPRAPEVRHRGVLESPLGRVEVVSNGRAITGVAIETAGRLPHDGHPVSRSDLIDEAVAQIEAYFAGTRRRFELPVRPAVSDFQRSVLDALADVEWGRHTTYGALAEAIGRPAACRAVGRAIGQNPVPLLVPCHRVLSSTGSLTGYSQGDGDVTKAWLLDGEGIAFRWPPTRRRPAPVSL
ncbi:methylated-DNA--[protein]-cysteine S-methyltransferase [Cnuibacter physcomitrellae]|uniref:methylated-DNA--[protein]-cysteine S-methyltransferase n=1 Tax=Cnuibacter physcomitrellae TaxID=1619308 RepID=UPI002175D93F|nr:methylated-DNA--[protein]-cysteine S-methyltransferase [Cnuibacter physcomitrellae]MCS5496731.1 methylated-DNA--[protein]-cysteine S-methyltransferase [Cnuibacter physcomitrellae]